MLFCWLSLLKCWGLARATLLVACYIREVVFRRPVCWGIVIPSRQPRQRGSGPAPEKRGRGCFSIPWPFPRRCPSPAKPGHGSSVLRPEAQPPAGHPGTRGCQFRFFGPISRYDPWSFGRPFVAFMISINSSVSSSLSSFCLGRYRIAPSARALPCGAFASQVSIASGRGSASTARLLRFTGVFATPGAAEDHAMTQGIAWAHQASPHLLTSAPVLN